MASQAAPLSSYHGVYRQKISPFSTSPPILADGSVVMYSTPYCRNVFHTKCSSYYYTYRSEIRRWCSNVFDSGVVMYSTVVWNTLLHINKEKEKIPLAPASIENNMCIASTCDA